MVKMVFRKCFASELLAAIFSIVSLIIDSFFIGRFLGVDSLAAYGYSFVIMSVIFSIGQMLQLGGEIVASKYVGRGDLDKANETFCSMLAFSIVFGLVLMVVCLLNVGGIASLLCGTNVGEVFELTKDYLLALSPCITLVFLFYSLLPFIRLDNKQTQLAVSMVVMIVSNVVLDLLACFVLKNGMFGMGLATTTSFVLSLATLVIFSVGKNNAFRFSLKKISFARLGRVFGEGVLNLINNLAIAAFMFLFNRLLKSFGGTEAVAAYAVISNMLNLCAASSNGISSITSSLSANFYADKDKRSLVQTFKTNNVYMLVSSVVLIVLIWLLARPLAVLFVPDDPITADMTVAGLRMAVLGIPFTAFIAGIKKIYQVFEYRFYVMIIMIMQNFAVHYLFVLLFSKITLDYGTLFVGFVCSEAFVCLVILVVSMIKNRSAKITNENLVLIPQKVKDDRNY
ncbi:MAG: hypothetical protein HUJ63_13765, partial [Enterococcus sp.]|nr:hypothetical protein [Enterococcus sp.]